MDSYLLKTPVEILCAIFTLLDPISLIAVSQTSQALRNTISPSRNDFIQRLLALELLPEFGGIVPRFRGRDGAITPPFKLDSPEWRGNKYACLVCLKLRSHMFFDNHSILRLRTRKPPPGSQEATKLATWVPLEIRDPARRQKRAQRRAAATAEKGRLGPERAVYHRYCTGVDFESYTNPFRDRNFDFGPFDKQAEEVEKMLCGTERHKRACNNCRYLRGDWSYQGLPPALGRPGAPIIRSRQIAVPHIFERHFPGFLDFLHKRNPALSLPETHPRLLRMWLNANHRHDTWTLFTAYCGSCLQWQELAGFGYIAWIIFRLTLGWNELLTDFDSRDLKRFRRAAQRIVSGLPTKPLTRDRLFPKLDFDGSMLPELRVRMEYLRSFIRDELPAHLREHYSQGLMAPWLEDYELNEAVYLQIKKAMGMIEEQPGIVEQYLDERDPYRL
ncbi:hypothetical protein QBC39DRAFT_416308 [Podospora conica]|nr:hypothetical protein QBC39DRAFT_416308 [Schizothecium conicum]